MPLAGQALRQLMLVWLGVAVGVSLVAAPVPFMVDELARGEALSVNRQLFRMAMRAELGLLLILLVLAVIARPAGALRIGIVAIALIVLVQGLVLQPELARRTDLVLAGVEPEPGPYHAFYVALEVIKMVLLGGLALWRRGPAGL